MYWPETPNEIEWFPNSSQTPEISIQLLDLLKTTKCMSNSNLNKQSVLKFSVLSFQTGAIPPNAAKTTVCLYSTNTVVIVFCGKIATLKSIVFTLF